MTDMPERIWADAAIMADGKALAGEWNYQDTCNADDTPYIRADLAAASQWQPIETAPKDGSFILLHLRHPWRSVRMARWFAPWGVWVQDASVSADDEMCGIGSAVPTHWMPLPEPPR